MIPRNSTTRPPGVEERSRVEKQEEEQDHRKDPGFARPITLASACSSRVGVLCEYFARFSFSRLGGEARGRGGHVGLGLGKGGLGMGLGDGLASCGVMRRQPDVRQEFPAGGPSQVFRRSEQIL